MVLDLTIKTVSDESDLGRLKRFLHTQELWYPNYHDWVEDVCITEIDRGFKTGIIAYSKGDILGDAIYQPHKELPRTREFKNMRIHPKFGRRDLGHFLLRQVEEEDKETFDRIILDTDVRNKGVIEFLRFCGYKPIMQMPLYDQNNEDVVMVKEISFPHKSF